MVYRLRGIAIAVSAEPASDEHRPVPRDSRRAGRIERRTTPRKQERVLPQGRRKSKKNCPPSQPISSRTKKQRRDPPYCTNLHLVRRRGVLDKENECRRRQPGTPRWFSWLPTIPSRRGRTLHSRPGGHCTALHCTATALGASTIIVDYKPVAKQERNAFLASAACCTNPPNRRPR